MATMTHKPAGPLGPNDSAPTRLRVLILEDSKRDADLCIQELKKAGIEVYADVVDTEDAFVLKLQSQIYDVILSDYRIPAWGGVEAFRLFKQSGKDIPFILITGTLGEEAAVDLIKEGVADYILKDRLVRLPSAVGRALQEKTTRDALRRSESRLRRLVESSIIGIGIGTLDGKLLDGNNAFLNLLGYTHEELLSGTLRWDEMTPLEYHDIDQRAVEQLRNTGVAAPWEKEFVRKDGSRVAVLIGVVTLVTQQDDIEAVSFVVDISERKKAEERFQKAFNANPEPITIATVAEGRYIDVNESFLRVTGYERKEVIGRTSLELKFWERPEDRARFTEILKKQGSVRGLEIDFLTKSGERRTGLDSAEVIEVAGEKCIIAIFRDFTEQKFLEKQLRQAQKMEAVGQLAGGIAHDFNNLLGVIIGYSEIFEERLGQNDPLRPKAEQIKKAGQRAAELTRQLLAFSRQQVLEPRVLDLNGVVVDTLKMLQRLIGEDIELITVPGPELGRVKADQGQVEQVIMNLAVNARDAMRQGGRLTITIANAEMDEVSIRQHPGAVPGSYVMLALSDTGCGMDQETQARIFEPFFTTKELGKGTGLGLSTVYGVVKQSGGYISVYSEPGRGSTFKIYFPRVGEAVTASEPDKGGKEIRRGWETLLLVEDARPLRELARELLEDSGYTVLEAANGADAIRVAEQHQQPIHLLITDVVMPGMDGRKLAERMTRSYPEVKVLYMSGYTDDAIVHHGVLDSGVALLQKPFTRESLTRKVRAALGADER